MISWGMLLTLVLKDKVDVNSEPAAAMFFIGFAELCIELFGVSAFISKLF